MNPKISGTFIFIIVLATFITGVIVYPYVGNNFELAFGLPIGLLILWGIWALLPRIDPIAKGFHGFRYVYDLAWILISALLAYSYALKLGETLGWQVNVLHAMIPAIALLFLVIGSILPKIRRNWFFGIRTPWTLSSDEDWAKTHRFAQPVFIIAGLVTLIGAFTPRSWSIGFIVGPILIAAFTSIIYSYLVFHHR